eukprot:gene18159-27983_t
MVLRVGERKRTPERVEGLDRDWTLRQVKELALWVLQKEDADPSGIRLVVDGTMTPDDDNLTLADCDVRNNAVVIVEFGVSAEPGESPVERAPATCSASRTVMSQQDSAVIGFLYRLSRSDSGALCAEGEKGTAVLLPRVGPHVLWILNLSGELFPPREKNSFKLSLFVEARQGWRGYELCDVSLEELSERLHGLCISSVEAAPDRTVLSLHFAKERMAATWVYRHSRTVSQLPYETFCHVSSFLSPSGQLEISAVDTTTRVALPLLPFEL